MYINVNSKKKNMNLLKITYTNKMLNLIEFDQIKINYSTLCCWVKITILQLLHSLLSTPLFIQTFRRNFVGILHRKFSPFADWTSCKLFPRPPTTCCKFIHFVVSTQEKTTYFHNLLFIVGDYQVLEYFTSYMFLFGSLGHARRFNRS